MLHFDKSGVSEGSGVSKTREPKVYDICSGIFWIMALIFNCMFAMDVIIYI